MFRGSGHAVKLWRDWPVATTLKPEVIADVFCVYGRNLKLQVEQQRVFAMRLPPVHSFGTALELQIPVFNMIIRFTQFERLSDFMAVTPQELS